MLSENELAKLLVNWKQQQGEEIKTRFCVPVDRSARLQMYKNLIKTLVELHGYNNDDLEGNTYRRVMEASINPNSEKKEQWRQAATADWNDAIASFFPQQVLVHDSSQEPERPKREKREQISTESAYSDAIELENPWDSSVSTDIPLPESEIDHEFLKLIQGKGDE